MHFAAYQMYKRTAVSKKATRSFMLLSKIRLLGEWADFSV